jgi:tetracycline 7-halogenase / FADH2 O2-dependent halogenase
MTAPERDRPADVVVLGSHLATALLATILARHGVRVTLVPTERDRDTPTGETTIPYTAELFFLLASRFDIPEIWDFGMFDRLPSAVRATSGLKRSLGFLYHRADRPHRTDEAVQFNVPAEHAEWHPYRPDVDAYAERLATSYGATLERGAAAPGGVTVTENGVAVRLADGRTVHGELLVDGSGDPRLLPAGVPPPSTALVLHTARLLTATLPAVRPFEFVVPQVRYGPESSPWSGGTLLHVFEGGWLQLVPFGNHGRPATRVSVVASLDPGRYPERDVPPAAEFDQLVRRFPQLAEQFTALDTVAASADWQRYPAWPAAAPRTSGPRWLLFDRAAGRQDFALSRDLSLSLELVHALAAALLPPPGGGAAAGAPDRWSAARAAAQLPVVAEFQHRMLLFHDRLLVAARAATADFPLWNAFLRVWLLWSIVSTMSLRRARTAGPDSCWASVGSFDQAPYWYQVPAGLPELVDEVLTELAVSGGTAAGPHARAELTGRIFRRLRAAPFVPPVFDFADPHARYYNLSRARRLRTLLWSRLVARSEFRSLFMRNNVTGTPEAPDAAHSRG